MGLADSTEVVPPYDEINSTTYMHAIKSSRSGETPLPLKQVQGSRGRLANISFNFFIHSYAGVVELVDTLASGASGGNPMEVQLLSPALPNSGSFTLQVTTRRVASLPFGTNGTTVKI